MDVNLLRSTVTVVMGLMFVGIVIWTLARSRRAEFEEAAALPFVDSTAAPVNRPTDGGVQ